MSATRRSVVLLVHGFSDNPENHRFSLNLTCFGQLGLCVDQTIFLEPIPEEDDFEGDFGCALLSDALCPDMSDPVGLTGHIGRLNRR